MNNGILVINKESDMTSHDVVNILRRKLDMKRIGHTGTLDPLATGVLPICIGNATRISEYIMNQGKSYIATLKFGEMTTTYDSEGDLVKKSDNTSFSIDEINNVLDQFIGKVKQKPPIYSAIKVDGKKLYEYARENKEVEIKSREVEIYDIKLLSLENEILKIEVSCSKGTYIRSLINDIGLRLNTYAHMTNLIRNKVGKFNLENSIDISDIKNYDISKINDMIIPMEECLYNLNKINILNDVEFRLKNGQRININELDVKGNYDFNDDLVVKVNDKFLGIGKIKDNILKMEKVLCQ